VGAFQRGAITSFVNRHRLRWELAMAALTILYVVLAVIQDEDTEASLNIAVAVLAAIFLAEFCARWLDAESRPTYLRQHWVDLVTCLPAVGPLRLLRLVRLFGLLRLASSIRNIGMAEAELNRRESPTWFVWPTVLLLWVGAAYGFWILERGANPHIHTFGDALYLAFVTVTTVGYGSVKPVTPAGGILAGLLVFLGLGLLGFLSAQLTARWLRHERGEASVEQQVAALRQETAELKAMLETIAIRLQAGHPPP